MVIYYILYNRSGFFTTVISKLPAAEGIIKIIKKTEFFYPFGVILSKAKHALKTKRAAGRRPVVKRSLRGDVHG